MIGNVAWDTDGTADFENMHAGWIPPEQRTPSQQALSDEYFEQVGVFEDLCAYAEIPERLIFQELEVAATGGLIPRVHQQTGSCVGSAAAQAYVHSMCGDVIRRGEHEGVMLPFPFATYGVGREIAGMRGTGDGSFGGAQAKAVEQFGMLPHDWSDHNIPDPQIRNGWAAWSASEERQWSHPRAWPVPRSELEPHAQRFSIEETTRVTDVDSIPQAIARGLGVTEASMFGSKPTVRDGVLIGSKNRSWSHQMNICGFWFHPRLGLIFLINNQWNDVHGRCPALEEISRQLKVETINGSFWTYKDDMAYMVSRGEVIVHAGTGGFDPPIIKHNLEV